MLKYFSYIDLRGIFKAYTFPHYITLLILLVFMIIMIIVFKKIKNEKARKIFCYVLGAVIYLQEIVRISWYIGNGVFELGKSLPLHLCGFAIILCPIMLVKKSYFLYELNYFWGIGGALQALLTPNLQYPFPHVIFFTFFLSHGLIVVSCIYMTFIVGFRPTWKSIIKTAIATNVLLGIIAVINLLTNGNYMFLCEKPDSTTLLSYLGPWPWYILSLEGVGLTIFLILYAPFFIKDILTPKKKPSEEPV